MQCVTVTTFLDGCINKVASTFTARNKPRIAEGMMFEIVPILFKEASKNEKPPPSWLITKACAQHSVPISVSESGGQADKELGL